jgi:hypothetical protein
VPGEDRSAVATSSDGGCRQVAEEVCGSRRFSTVLAWIGRPIQPGEGFLCWRFTL